MLKYSIFTKKIICIVLLLCACDLFAAPKQQLYKLAVVDLQTLLASSNAMHVIQKFLDSESKKIESDLNSSHENFKSLEQLLYSKQSLLSEENFQKEVVAFQEKINFTQQELRKRRILLEKAHSQAVSEVQAAISKIIKKVAEEHSVDIVFASSTVLYTKPSLDLTNEIILKLNNALNSIKINYPPNS